MTPLRAFLLARQAADNWDVSVHRELDSLREAWRCIEGRSTCAVIHLGFWRPSTEAFEGIADQARGRVLLTAPARYAMPPPCPVTSLPVCAVEGLPIYVALEGWGYSITSEEAQRPFRHSHSSTDDAPLPFAKEPTHPQNWVESLHVTNPRMAQSAREHGIVDEQTYITGEDRLPDDLRRALGLRRFVFLSRSRLETETILQNLRFAPPWLLRTSIARLDLSVRSANRMREHAVDKVGDLAGYSEQEIRKFNHLGRKSVHEIASKIVSLFSRGPLFGERVALPESSAEQVAVPAVAKELAPNIASGSGGQAKNLQSLLGSVLGILPGKERKVMRLRMGFEGAPNTLQEIGDIFGVSRERVRQIEAKAVRRVMGLVSWKAVLEDRLTALLEPRREPLPLLGLSILDPWFDGAEALEHPLGYAFDHFCGGRFALIRAQGEVFVSRLSRSAWEQALRDGRRLLQAAVGHSSRESELRSAVDSLLIGNGEELRPTLWAEVSRWAHFAEHFSSDVDRILVRVGSGIENAVEAVLTESDQPLHFTEIADRCAIRLGRSADPRQVHNAAAHVGLLFGRGTYGLTKHFPLSDEERRLLVAEAEDLLAGGEDSRQWHAREIADALEERGLDFGDKIDPYVVSIALRESRNLVYLGRMVWTQHTTGARGSGNRIDVHQAVIALLMQEGRPMRSDELRARIGRERGLAATFQIQPESPLLRMGPGLWGLVTRDVPFSDHDLETIVSALVAALRHRQRGLHVSEIKDALKDLPDLGTRVADSTLLLGLAQNSGRVAVARGQYAYLPEWEGPRRMTIIESVKRALEHAPEGGLTLDQITTAAERHVERTIHRLTIRSMCAKLGAIFNPSTNGWSLLPDEDETREVEKTNGESEMRTLPLF